MDESSITISESYTTYTGTDATNLYRAAVIRAALKLLLLGIKPTRAATLTNTLKMSGEYTGQKYKRTSTEARRAIADLNVWIETMKSAIPVEHK